jgi:hypothetical protein
VTTAQAARHRSAATQRAIADYAALRDMRMREWLDDNGHPTIAEALGSQSGHTARARSRSGFWVNADGSVFTLSDERFLETIRLDRTGRSKARNTSHVESASILDSAGEVPEEDDVPDLIVDDSGRN